MRLVGPNCAGLVSLAQGLWSTYSAAVSFQVPQLGTVGIATQSGAIGAMFWVAAARRGVRFSRFIATGNEADVDVAAVIAFMARDPHTKVILAYLESAKNGERFIEALKLAHEAGKPVIVLKGGSSDIGAQTAASHTGSLAGTDEVYEAAIAQCGAFRARTMEEMLDLAYALSIGSLPKGRRLRVMSGSGGVNVLVADIAGPMGLELPPLTEECRAAIKAIIPLAGVRNPIDHLGFIANDFGVFPKLLDATLLDDNFDIYFNYLSTSAYDEAYVDSLVAANIDMKRRIGDRALVLAMLTPPEIKARLEDAGIVLFEDIERATKAYARLAVIADRLAQPLPAVPKVASQALPQGALDEASSRDLLEAAGIAFPPQQLVTSAADATAAARKLNAPVAMKIVSPDIAHKTEAGGVMLGVGADAAATAFQTIMDSVRKAQPNAKVRGVSVAPMIAGGVETVMGTVNDATFGPVVMFGLGGIHVEVLRDVVFRLAPFDEKAAEEMIRSIRSFALLDGARGRPRMDIATLARSLAALSRFAAAHRDDIDSIDINPFIALPSGGAAADALIVRRGTSKKQH
jgi:acyl-CoA synthetase (NDP forming)